MNKSVNSSQYKLYFFWVELVTAPPSLFMNNYLKLKLFRIALRNIFPFQSWICFLSVSVQNQTKITTNSGFIQVVSAAKEAHCIFNTLHHLLIDPFPITPPVPAVHTIKINEKLKMNESLFLNWEKEFHPGWDNMCSIVSLVSSEL